MSTDGGVDAAAAGRAARVETIVLASASPRRAELLRQIGVRFEVLQPARAVDETPRKNEPPARYVVRLAREKAAAVGVAHPHRLVLAADTTVVLDDRILGKPEHAHDAAGMLLALQGREHVVMTGLAVGRATHFETALATARVRFRPVDVAEAQAYARTGEGLDKAGGYGIQGIGAIFAESIAGSFSTVVGLPLVETERLLRAAGLDTWAMRGGR